MWQKARLIRGDKNYPQLIGKEFYVIALPPFYEDKCLSMEHIPTSSGNIYYTNIIDEIDEALIGTRQDSTELLGEIKEDVPLITLEEWLK